MSEVYRITEKGKKAIVDLLNKSLRVEYAFIANYPRLIDQMVNIDQIPDEQTPKDLERLGSASYRHAGQIGQLIIRLGGEPNWRVEVIERIVDIHSMLIKQLEREKLAQSLYQQAKRVAEQNPVKSKGFLDKLTALLNPELRDVTERSDTIRVLEHIAAEEYTHIRIVEDIIASLHNYKIKYPPKK